MINGCKTPFQVGEDIDDKPGAFQQNDLVGIFDCSDDPNLWNPMAVPQAPLDSDRWMPIFIVDDEAFTEPSDKTHEVRGFAMFYVTAMTGLECPGDYPDLSGKGSDREIWGHFVRLVIPGFGETIPSTVPCSFESDGLCVSNLVE